MITRPLDLSSRLRAAPRSFDALFWVNVGALVLFFGLFGSRFVLAPGLGVDFYLPELGGARGGAVRTTHVISMARSGLVFTDDGALPLEQIGGWLAAQKSKAVSFGEPVRDARPFVDGSSPNADGVERTDYDGSEDDVNGDGSAATSAPALAARAVLRTSPVLLIRASAGIPVADLAAVTSAAQAHGFRVQIAALEPETSGARVGEGGGE